MASKKTGRLAGLAALAGAAYLADKKGMFGGKGKDVKADVKADAKADAKDTPADRENAEMGAAMRSNMAATPKMSPTSSGDLMSEKEPGWETKSAPTSVARPTATRAPAAAPATRAAATPPTNEDAFGNVSTGRAPATRAPVAAPAVSKKPMSSGTIDYRPDPRAPSIYADEKTLANYRAEQEAGIDKEKYNEFLKKRPGMMERMRDKDKAAASTPFKKGGAVKKMASGGMTSSASKRGDGIATKGKTRGKMC